jgi:hypothetical protein
VTDKTTTRDALDAVMQEVLSIAKTERNSFHGFMYRGVEAVMNTIGPALRKHHIVPFPEVVRLDSRDVLTKRGDTNREVTVWVKYTFKGPAGDSEVIVVPGEAQDSGASAVSKAMAVAQRIGYLQALAIPTVGPDPESSDFERGTDKVVSLKKLIWEEGKERGWVLPDDNYERLAEEFTTWSEGLLLEQADEKLLQGFVNFLKPPRKMQRKQPGGQP